VRSIEGNFPPDMVLQDRYKIIKLIHTGPVSRTYQGFDLKNKKNIFVKEITVYTDPYLRQQALEQFKCEAKILFKLKHESLPKFKDYFDYEDRRYLILEYIEGKNLTTFIEHQKHFLPEEDVIKWGLELCDVLLYLHNMKPNPIIFRDMSPYSIILSSDGKLKLIDFGISKVFEAQVQTLGIAKTITPHYSPIEQYTESTDKRSDIYSLGATMYYLITMESPMDCIDRSLDDEPLVPCRQLNPDISPELETIIMKAMEIDRINRYQDVREMKDDLEKITTLSRKSILSKKIPAVNDKLQKSAGLLERFSKGIFARRHTSGITPGKSLPKSPSQIVKKSFLKSRKHPVISPAQQSIDKFYEALPEYIPSVQEVEDSSWKRDHSSEAVMEYVSPLKEVSTSWEREQVVLNGDPLHPGQQMSGRSKSGDFYIDIGSDKRLIKRESLSDMYTSISRNKIKDKISSAKGIAEPFNSHLSLSVNDIIVNRYKILSLIFTSKRSYIYRALDEDTGQEVAIKELLMDSSTPLSYRKEIIKHFRMVAGLFFKFNHINLPKFQNYIEVQRCHYLVMDFIKGKNLRDIVSQMPGLPKENQLLRWGLQLCDVLSYLHRMRPNPVVLRNLKPDNIFLEDTGNLKLMGFGLCKIFDTDKITLSFAKHANTYYSPPEQYGGETDTLTDIYSLGASLYYLATKIHPVDAIERTVGTAHLVECFLYNQSISNRLSGVIHKAMSLKKSDRYQSVVEMERELRIL